MFTFMPALTLAAYQWMDKTYHRPLLPSFDKFGRFVARIMLPMALVLVILMLPSYLASNSNQYYYEMCIRDSHAGVAAGDQQPQRIPGHELRRNGRACVVHIGKDAGHLRDGVQCIRKLLLRGEMCIRDSL